MDEDTEDRVGGTQERIRCNGMEVMWSEVAQVAGDEEGMGTGGKVSGRQMEGEKVMRRGHLLAWDRSYVHMHISGLRKEV
jgi:hypothetical protein